MQDFFDYLGTLVMVPIAVISLMGIAKLVTAAPIIIKIVAVIGAIMFVIYLIPYFIRAFIWSLIPAWYLAEFIQKYKFIPVLVNKNGPAPLIDTIILCVFGITALILLIFRRGWIMEDRTTNDPCVPFARNRYKNKDIENEFVEYPNAEPVMAKKKNPIGFIWDEE